MLFSVLTQQKKILWLQDAHQKYSASSAKKDITFQYLIFHYNVTNMDFTCLHVFYSPYIYFYENFNGRKKSHCFPSNLLCTFTSLYSFILYSTLSLCWHSDFLHHVFLLWKSFPNYNLLESKFLWDFFQSI